MIRLVLLGALAWFWSLNIAVAEPIKMTCSSIFQDQESITVTIDTSGLLLLVERQGTTAWQFDSNSEDATFYSDAMDVLDETDLVSELKKIANPNGEQVTKALLSIIAPVWTRGMSLREKIDFISSDMSGLVYLEMWNGTGSMVGNAFSWSLAGYFTGCF